MRIQKKIFLFITSLTTFVLIFVNACVRANEKIILEIKETIVGDAEFTGDILIFRMNQNQEVEFDSIVNSELPLSQSNLIRKKITLSEQDADQIQSFIQGLEKSDFNKFYPSIRKQALDVSHSTIVTFTDERGENKTIDIQGDLGQVSEPTSKQKYPQPLVMLLKKIIDIRGT